MSENGLNILAISYAKNILDQNSREFIRMQSYAKRLGRYEIIVFTRESDGYNDLLKVGNLTVYPTNSASKIRMIFDAIKIGKKIILENKNLNWIVSSQDPFESSLVGRAIAKTSNLAVHHVQVHGDICNKAWRQESALNHLRYRYGIYILKRTHKIRVVSQRIKKSLIDKKIAGNKITVLPIQPNLDKFMQAGKFRIENFNLNKVNCNFIYVGRFAPEKNLPLILEAFKAVYKNNNNCSLTLVGRGSEETKIQKFIKDHKLDEVIRIVTWTDDVAGEMAKADVFLLASAHEGWGMVLVEAMAVGLPVITTDVGCVGELVKAGEHGLVVEVDNPKNFMNAMMTLSKDVNKRHEMSVSAYNSALALKIDEADYLSQWVGSFV